MDGRSTFRGDRFCGRSGNTQFNYMNDIEWLAGRVEYNGQRRDTLAGRGEHGKKGEGKKEFYLFNCGQTAKCKGVALVSRWITLLEIIIRGFFTVIRICDLNNLLSVNTIRLFCISTIASLHFNYTRQILQWVSECCFVGGGQTSLAAAFANSFWSPLCLLLQRPTAEVTCLQFE